MKSLSGLLIGLALGSLVLCGCQPASSDPAAGSSATGANHDHEHGDHDHPQSLAEGQEVIGKLFGEIRAAFEKGDPDAAHDQLHEVGHILEGVLPDLVKNDAGLSDEAKSSIQACLEKMFDEFGKLDDQLHGGPEADFAEISRVIDGALQELKGLLP
ncbi:MAG: hypothetical protein KF752_03720 [Pirellulaceae bacterium]|nr:hypothetical protein [Pirellulaceae bacterium]